MKWEQEARDAINAIPVPEIIKDMTTLYAEKLARADGVDTVTMDHINRTRDDYFEMLGDSYKERISCARCEGKSDSDVDPEIELNKGPSLFRVELCHQRFFGCPRQILDVKEAGKKVKEKLEEIKLTEIIADKTTEPFMPHNFFTVSISSCPNNCSAAETKDFGIYGVREPEIDEEKCNQCGKCIEVCPDDALLIKHGKIKLNSRACVICGACIEACPVGAIKNKKEGVRVLVGGRFGRWHTDAKELFKNEPFDTAMKALEAAVDLIKNEAGEHEHLYHLVNRLGLKPIYEKIV
ncbi:MAG: 4Fe-4S dicluster domain-containing protein [Candidatus Schekmanbacteria bacterium]|nr:MAG: 4Fe-4S dicluster domain-containing protein [Candidatus Schekmanbacteria bacterium]